MQWVFLLTGISDINLVSGASRIPGKYHGSRTGEMPKNWWEEVEVLQRCGGRSEVLRPPHAPRPKSFKKACGILHSTCSYWWTEDSSSFFNYWDAFCSSCVYANSSEHKVFHWTFIICFMTLICELVCFLLVDILKSNKKEGCWRASVGIGATGAKMMVGKLFCHFLTTGQKNNNKNQVALTSMWIQKTCRQGYLSLLRETNNSSRISLWNWLLEMEMS